MTSIRNANHLAELITGLGQNTQPGLVDQFATVITPVLGQLIVQLDSDDAPLPDAVPYLCNYCPAVGDRVWMHKVNGQWLAVDGVGNSGWINTGLTPASADWSTIGTSEYLRMGGLVHLKVAGVVRANTTIVSASTGNITDNAVLHLPNEIVPNGDLYVGHWSNNSIGGSAVIRASLAVWQLVDMYPSTTLAIGSAVNGYYVYRIDAP